MTASMPYRLATAEGRGLGLFATRPIAIGELILADTPFLTANSDMALSEAAVDLAVASLSPEDKAMFLSFTDSFFPDAPKPVTIFRSNALPVGTDDMGGMYALGCRVNHSCLPNVHHIWSDRLSRLAFYARTDIPEGAELLDGYVPHYASRKKRQNYLFQHLHFNCGCSICSGPADRESDARRERIDKLAALHLKHTVTNPAVALRHVKERLRLMDEEGLHDLCERSADYYSGAKIGALCGDFDSVRRQMGLAYAHRVLYAGQDDERIKDMLAVYREPRTHVLASMGSKDRVLPSICDTCGEQELGGFEGNESGGGECADCHCSLYCSRECREANAARHKPVCAVLCSL